MRSAETDIGESHSALILLYRAIDLPVAEDVECGAGVSFGVE